MRSRGSPSPCPTVTIGILNSRYNHFTFVKLLSVLLILFLLIACQPVAGLDGPIPIPPNIQAPTDPDGDGKYEDLNGNLRKDFADVVLFFNQMTWIAANEPIVAFDFNGNGRIDFADVVSLFNELGSSPPTPRVIISATVAPSDEDRSLRGDGVNLTIPGGTLNQTSSVRVATVASPPAPPEGTSNLTVFDVTVGTQVRFMPGLAIEIPYTPAMIPPGTSPARVIQGIRWDEGTGAWRLIPTAVDTARGVVVLETDHLCVLGYTAKLAPAPVTEIWVDDFVIHYDPSDNMAIQEAWKGSPDVAGEYPDINTAYRLASYVGIFLEEANTTFVKQQGFKKPVRSRFSFDNKIHVYVGDYYETSWNQFTKTITVSRTPFTYGPGAKYRLAAEMRHEFFHAVQNAYVSTGWMHKNRWWTEATAEYAGNLGSSVDPAYPLDDSFYSKPLDTVNGKHEYQAAIFVGALTNSGPFRSLWEATTTGWDPDTAIQDFLKKKGQTIGTVYEDLMVDSKLVEWRSTGFPGDSNFLAIRQPVIDGAQQLADENMFDWYLPSNGMGTVSPAFRVSTSEDRVQLFEAYLSGRASLPDDTHLKHYVADGSTGKLISWGGPIPTNTSFDTRDGDIIVYTIVRGLSSGEPAYSDAILLNRPEISISPEFAEVDVGESVDFTVTVENIPSGVPLQVLDAGGNVVATGTGSGSLRFSKAFPWATDDWRCNFVVRTKVAADWYGFFYSDWISAHVKVI